MKQEACKKSWISIVGILWNSKRNITHTINFLLVTLKFPILATEPPFIACHPSLVATAPVSWYFLTLTTPIFHLVLRLSHVLNIYWSSLSTLIAFYCPIPLTSYSNAYRLVNTDATWDISNPSWQSLTEEPRRKLLKYIWIQYHPIYTHTSNFVYSFSVLL